MVGFVFATLLMVMFSLTANAYLDPSVMTYAIQALAGIAIAVGAAAGIYWRRMKKKVNKKLGIDENAKKEVEEDILELDAEESQKQK